MKRESQKIAKHGISKGPDINQTLNPTVDFITEIKKGRISRRENIVNELSWNTFAQTDQSFILSSLA